MESQNNFEYMNGRIKTVLCSAAEVLEDIAVNAARRDDLEEARGTIELFMLQILQELENWPASQS